MNKAQLIESGWTIPECLRRMKNCRKGIAESRERSKQSETARQSFYTYRWLFVAEYERIKRKLTILRS